MLGLAVFAFLAIAAPAGATLRSPHLSSSCASGFSYGEFRFGAWRVEGCSKETALQGDETARRAFQGTVELNGMLVEGSKNLVATTRSPGANDINRILRSGNAKLVLDPKIAGNRRRIVLFSGEVDLEIETSPSQFSASPEGGRPEVAPVHVNAAAEARQPGKGADVDLPVSGVPALLGLRVRDSIEDARVFTSSDSGEASIEFDIDVSMGAAASVLLRDWIGRAKIKTVDGIGMTVDALRFKIPNIEIPGIGGFEGLNVKYSADDDEWSGGVGIDFGELFPPAFEFNMSISASTGAPTAIQAAVDNLNIPLGDTGIFLQGLRAGFDTNPLIMNAGATATAGPEFAGVALIEMSGDLEIKLEPGFRLEASGNARMLPVGNSELGRGDIKFILDSDGFISLSGSAGYSVLFLGVGIGAEIGGSGAYSTTNDRFNIAAHATGTLYLGYLGSIDVVEYQAVVSDDGYGACGNVTFFMKAGLGQHWDGNPTLMIGCDLSPYNDPISHGRIQAARAERTETVDLPESVKTAALEITADGPEPDVTVTGPGGTSVRTLPAGPPREIAGRAAVWAHPGANVQYVFVKDPPAGRYTVTWSADAPQVTNVRLARDIAPVSAKLKVSNVAKRPGRRLLQASAIKGIGAGETVTLGVKTPAGIVPLGTTAGGMLKANFQELRTGRAEIVATVEREGVPLPARTRVIGHYMAKMPAAPGRVRARRRGAKVRALALPRRGAELPDRWQYVLRQRGRPIGVIRSKPGRTATFTVGRIQHGLTVRVRPVVGRRVLRGTARTVRVGGR